MPNVDDMLGKLGKSLKAAGVDLEALTVGSQHPYSCKCEICWRWWHQVGIGDEGASAPFTEAQIEAVSYKAAMLLEQHKSDLVGLTEDLFAQHRADMEVRPCDYGNHTWVADPVKARHYKCANCAAEYHP